MNTIKLFCGATQIDSRVTNLNITTDYAMMKLATHFETNVTSEVLWCEITVNNDTKYYRLDYDNAVMVDITELPCNYMLVKDVHEVYNLNGTSLMKYVMRHCNEIFYEAEEVKEIVGVNGFRALQCKVTTHFLCIPSPFVQRYTEIAQPVS